VEWVTDLEGIDGISILCLNLFLDLLWSLSVSVESVVEFNFRNKSHTLSWNQIISLCHDSLNLVVLSWLNTKDSRRNFFLSVFKENWLFNNGKNIGWDLGAFNGNFLLILKGFVLLFGDVLGDWYWEEVSLSNIVSNSFQLDNFKELELIHEFVQRIWPSLCNSLKIFSLFNVDVDWWKAVESVLLFVRYLLIKRFNNSWLRVLSDDTIIGHSLQNEINALVKSLLTSFHVKFWGIRCLVWVWDTSEVLNLTSSCLLVETLNISGLKNFNGGVNEAFVEGKATVVMDGSRAVSVFLVWGDECNEAYLTWEGKELCYFRDSSNVLSSVFGWEAEVLIKALSNNVTVKDENFVSVTNHRI